MDSEFENYRSHKKFGRKDSDSSAYRLRRWSWLAAAFLVRIIFRLAIAFIWVAAHALWIVMAIFGGLIVGALDANSQVYFRQRQREKGDYRWG